MTTPYYQITARGPTVAEIRIDGPIGESFFSETMTAQAFVKELSAITATEIHLYLNSPGGSVMDANVISAALQRHPAQVKIIVDGWALSAASLIAMAGNTVSMGPRSLLMLHNPRAGTHGDAPALRKTAEVLDKIKSGMVDAYNARLKLEPAAVAAILDAETWYSAEEALTAGLIDAILPDATAVPAPVPAKIRNHFSFVPAAYAAYLQEPNPVADFPTPTDPVPTPTTEPPKADPAPTAELDAVRTQAVAHERARVKTIRAAFAPWIKKGLDVSALQAQCEDDGSDAATASLKLLHALGAMSEPLAAGQGATDATPAPAPYQAPRGYTADADLLAIHARVQAHAQSKGIPYTQALSELNLH